MKPILSGLLGLIVFGVVSLAAQPYAISGQTLAGGGIVRGGRFQVAGSIGQSDAGPRLTGDSWSVDPGFWNPQLVGSQPDGPMLTVRHRDFNYVRVSFKPGCGK